MNFTLIDNTIKNTVLPLTDMIPAISMAYEEAESDIMKRMPRHDVGLIVLVKL